MRSVLFILIVFSTTVAGFCQEVCPYLPVVRQGKWGFINCNGEVKVNFLYDKVSGFRNVWSTVSTQNKTGVIDTSGRLVVPALYESAEILNSGFFVLKNRSFGLADKNGEILTAFDYASIFQLDTNSFVLKEKTGKYRLYHAALKKTSDETWERVELIKGTSFVQVWQGNKTGVLNPFHHLIIAPQQADRYVAEKNYLVKDSSKHYSFYSMEGKFLSQGKCWKFYKAAGNNFVIVYNKPNDLSLLSLQTSKYILEHLFYNFRELSADLIITYRNSKKGLADVNGKIITANIYDTLKWYNQDFILVKSADKYGLISREGKTVLPLTCDFIDNFNEFNLAVYSVNHLLGIIKKDGHIFHEPHYDLIETDGQALKCYKGSTLDVYSFNAKAVLEEKITYNNVHRITMGGRYKISENAMFGIADYNDAAAGRNNAFQGIMLVSGNSKYDLILKGHKYHSNTRMKTMIQGNIIDITCLVGARLKEGKKPVIAPDYWDIDLNDLENYDMARVIFPGGRHGFIKANGQTISSFATKKGAKTTTKFISYIGPFSSGLARVNLGGSYSAGDDITDSRYTMRGHKLKLTNGVWGYADTRGDLVIPAQFEFVSDFVKGKAIVKYEGKYGVIDSSGTYVIKPEYSFITWLPESQNRFFQLMQFDTLSGILNDKGVVLLKAEFDETGEVSEGLVAVRKGKKWGFADLNGAMVIEPVFQKANDFSEGVASVRKDYKWGFIDRTGNFVIPAEYRLSGSFHNGLAPVADKRGWTFIDHSGKVHDGTRYKRALDFSAGVAQVKSGRKWKFIDTTGRFLHKRGFSKTMETEIAGLFIVRKGAKYKLFNAAQRKLSAKGFQKIGQFSEGYANVSKNKKHGYIDTTGKVIIPLKYKGAGEFSEGLAKVGKGGKFGYINSKDSLCIDFRFQRSENFSQGYGVGILKGHTVVFDRHGNEVYMPEGKNTTGSYSDGYLLLGSQLYNLSGEVVEKIENPGSFKNGFSVFHRIEKMPVTGDFLKREILMDKGLIPLAEYSRIFYPENGYAHFSVYIKYGLADLNGSVILPGEYQNLTQISDGIFKVENFGEVGYIRKDGSWLWKVEK